MFAKSLASQNFLVRDVHFSPIFRLKTLEQFSTGWRELKPKKPQQPVLYLIGRDGGVSFQDQSQSEVIRKEIRDQYSFENNSY